MKKIITLTILSCFFGNCLAQNKEKIAEEVNQLFKKGTDAYKMRDLKTAEELLSKAIKLDPKHWQSFVNRGQLYLMEKKWDKGHADFKKAIEIKPTDPALHYDIGVIEATAGHFDDAIRHFSTAINLKKDYTKALSNRAEMYRLKKDTAAARKDLNAAKKVDKNVPLAYFTEAQMMIDKKDFKKAAVMLDSICKEFPSEMQPYMQRGLVRLELKKYKEANIDFSKVLFLKPNYAPAFIGRGKARFQLGQEAEACEDWTKAEELQHPDADELLGEFCNN
jgi:Tfp pilus assembly protein PilF